MPLYEYRCKQCGHQFEKIQSFSAPEEKICPVCGGEVEKLISAPAVRFKGSGWYETDYAHKRTSKSDSGSSHGVAESSGNGKPAATESKPTSSESSTPAASAKSD